MDQILAFFAIFENLMAQFGAALPFGYAFSAGMVASVNPCGFLMLPAFGAYYLGTADPSFGKSPVALRILRALLLGVVASLGFVLLFGGIGAVLSLGGRGLVGFFPWLGLIVGISLAILGLWLLVTGHSVGILAASRVQAPLGPGVQNVFLFGVAYGICSLSCTLPIFLVVVGTAMATGGFRQSLGQFVSYGMGMGLVLTAVTVGSAVFHGAVSKRLRYLLPHVHRISALFMMGAGLYIVYYWVVLGDLFGG